MGSGALIEFSLWKRVVKVGVTGKMGIEQRSEGVGKTSYVAIRMRSLPGGTGVSLV